MTPKKKPVEKSEITKPNKPIESIANSQSGSPIVGTGISAGELKALREAEEQYLLFHWVLQSSTDGILAVDRENQVLFANERFVEMWMIPQGVMATQDDTLLLQYVLDQLSDPQGFLQKVQELYNSAEESFDTLYFKDGKVFDRLSRPLLRGTEVRGRVWSFRDVTERKHIEEALRESEDRYRDLVEHSQDLISTHNLDGRLLSVNEAAARLTGYSREALLQMNMTDLLAPQVRRFFSPYLKKIQARGHARGLMSIQTASGETRIWEYDNSLRTEGSAVPIVRGIAHDITERVQVEEALAGERNLLRTVIDFSPYEIFMKDHECRYTLVNVNQAKVLGIATPAEAVGKTAFDFFPQELAALFHKDDLSIIQTGQPVYDVERQRKGPNGEGQWRLVSKVPLRDRNGNVTGVVGIGRDITERKRAEEALQRAEQRYRGLFEEAPAMYVITRDVEGSPVIADCNELFSRTLGFNRDELLGQPVIGFYSPASRVLLLEGGYQRALKGEFGTQERELLTRDGRIIPTLVSAVPERDAAGGIFGTRATFVDITERRQAEDELRSLKNELETTNLELQQALEREKRLACTDGLTGLCNQRYFFELADREIHAAIRHRRPLAFLMFDMDNFKQVNDTLGHAAGDKLLVMVAQTAVAQVRTSDVVARYGGDEFIIMLPHATRQQALPIAERIRAGVAAIRVEMGKEPYTLTLSIGIAETRHELLDEIVEAVIQRADKALYEAKQSGRDRTVIFGQDEAGAT